MLLHGRGDPLVQVRDQRLALGGHAHGLGVQLDHLVHGGDPRCLGVGDDGRDLAEGRVVLRGDAGIGGENHVGFGVGDGLEGDAVCVIEQDRCLAAQGVEFLLDPGQQAVAVLVTPVGLAHADGHHAEGQRHLVVGPPECCDAFRFLLDDGFTEGVLDGDGEGVSGGGGGTTVS